MKKRPSILNEDSTMLYNKWVSGIAKRDLQPEVITVNDIINRFRNRYDAPVVLPYPLDRVLDFLGEMFVKCADFRRTLAQSVNSPLISESKGKIQAVRSLNEKIQKIQDQIFSCTQELNKLVEK